MLFPHLAGIRVRDACARTLSVRLHGEAVASTAACSACGVTARRVHSRYERVVSDSPAGGREVELRLRIRRFFCDNTTCLRKIFSEQIGNVTSRYARHTPVARGLLTSVALALGGRAGARLSSRIAAPAGRMTLIRLIRALPLPEIIAPKALGVDDFALRRGHRYGTILIDMATHQPIDVLPDRTADTFAAWLDAHPGVEIICRDRGGAYAEAATRSAPQAVQVADRWHLLKNLSDAVDTAVTSHRTCLKPTPATPPARPDILPIAPPADSRLDTRTRLRHADIHQLRADGMGIYTISRHLALDPKTVRRYTDHTLDELLGHGPADRHDSILEPHHAYLRQRCIDGVTSTGALLAEIRDRGYRGGERTLRRYLIATRGTPATTPAPPPVPSSRTITAWIMRPPAKLTAADTAALAAACTTCPDLATIRDLAQGFITLVRERGGKHLTTWVELARNGPVPSISTFAAGLQKDWNAVTAGLTTTWSSGPVEGNVNRIKMIKRQMYGRANIDLLSRRIILGN